jgi:hypothetical protein
MLRHILPDTVLCTARFVGPCFSASFMFCFVPIAAQAQSIAEKDMSYSGLQVDNLRAADAMAMYSLGSGHTCVDLEQLLAVADFPIKVDAATQTASGWMLSEDRTFNLSFAKKTVTLGKKTLPLGAQDILITDLGMCADLQALEKWFPFTLEHIESDSMLVLTPKEPLPFQLKLEREQLRKQFEDENAAGSDAPESLKPVGEPYSWFNIPNVDVSMVSNVQKEPLQPIVFSNAYTVQAVGEALKMTSEALLQSNSKAVPQTLRLRLYRKDNDGGVLGLNGLTEFVLGDVNGYANPLVSSGGYGRGVQFSFYPLNLPDQFDQTTLRGDLPAGWEAELYRNNGLIGFQVPSNSGRYEFKNIPILFGDNLFKIILYGPQGQRREIIKRMNTGLFNVQRGQLLTRFALLDESRDLITIGKQPISQFNAPRGMNASGDFRYGLAQSFSLAGGFNTFRVDNKREVFGRLALQTSLFGNPVEIEGVKGTTDGWAGQVSWIGNLGGTGVNLRYAEFGGGFASDRVPQGTRRRVDANFNTGLSFKNWYQPILIRSQFDQSRDGVSTLSIIEQASLPLWGGSLGQSLASSTQFGGIGGSSVNGSLLYSKAVGSYNIRSTLNYDIAPNTRLSSVGVAVDRILDEQDRQWAISGGVDWSFDSKRGTVSAGLSKNLGFAALNVNGSASTNGSFAVGAALSFSLSHDGLGNKWAMSADSIAQSGSIIARVFEDRDGDGQMSDGDTPLPNARMQVGGDLTDVRTDADGMATVRGLPGYSAVNVSVDTSEASTIDLTQANISVIKTRPGSVNYVDVPLVISGSVEGQLDVRISGRKKSLPGAELYALDGADNVIATTRSEYDGYYLFPKLPVGTYRIVVPETQEKGSTLIQYAPQVVDVSRARPYPGGVNIVLASRSDGPRLAVRQDQMFADVVATQKSGLQHVSLPKEFAPKLPLMARYSDDHKLTLAALFGDEVMNLPLAAPSLPPTPAIVVIGPYFEETLATAARPYSKRAVSVKAPIS